MSADPATRVFVGDIRTDAVPPDDRGLAYGDGLFETLRIHAGGLPWWDAHWARLAEGARRLGLALPDAGQVRAESLALCAGQASGVLKLLLTRGSGGRGYAPPPHPVPTWMLSRHPLPAPVAGGLQATWSGVTLSAQPLLAGFKHCNRLEQVLARAECEAAGMDEALMRDADGHVVGATSANLFLLHQGQWHTPRVDRCGVAGICRAQLLEPLAARESRVSPTLLEAADAVFLCNAVRGILPLAALGQRRWSPHAAVEAARRALSTRHPGFAVAPSHP